MGGRSQVPGTWCHVPGAIYLAAGIRCQVAGARWQAGFGHFLQTENRPSILSFLRSKAAKSTINPPTCLALHSNKLVCCSGHFTIDPLPDPLRNKGQSVRGGS